MELMDEEIEVIKSGLLLLSLIIILVLVLIIVQ